MKNRLDHLRSELIKKREKIIQSLSSERGTLEVSSHGDLVDQSANYAERELLLGLTEHDLNMVKSIDAALKSIEEGSYGICEDCKKEIPEARLFALPTTTLCVQCQTERERSGNW